jgi:DNA-binding IclR family transcriptional regulator
VSPSAQGNPLQALIQVRRSELGLSYTRLAARAGLPRSTAYYLATTPVLQRSPSSNTLDRLATALELPPQTVRSAAAEALGLHVYVDEDEESRPGLGVLIASVEQLSLEDREHVAALVRSLLRRRRGNGQAASPEEPSVPR